MTTVDLTQLEEGESGRVVLVSGGHGLIRRLESLGIRVGKKVTKVTVRIDGFQVALGFGMARKVLVEIEK